MAKLMDGGKEKARQLYQDKQERKADNVRVQLERRKKYLEKKLTFLSRARKEKNEIHPEERFGLHLDNRDTVESVKRDLENVKEEMANFEKNLTS